MSHPVPKQVLWITTDHMRFDNIAAHGNPAMVTPNMDRLVNQGVTFTNCFVQNPVCQPSRASFMTGLYPQQTGVTWNGHSLPNDFWPTAPRVFKGAGYQANQIGKLHFEPHEENDLDPRPRNDYGFDLFWLAEEPGCYEDAYMTWLRTEYPEYVETFRIHRSLSPRRSRENMPDLENYKIGVLDAPWEASFSGWIATQAERMYSQAFRRQSKMMTHLGFYSPHPPLNPTREMFEPYADAELPPFNIADHERPDPSTPRENLRNHQRWTEEMFQNYQRHFYAMVTGVDMAIGRVMADLERDGLLDDTLIVLTSDHGDMCGDHWRLGKGYTMYWDECIRVPWVMHWPRGLGTEGRRVDGVVEMVDMLPTMLGLCNASTPDLMVGRDYAPALFDRAPVETREDALCYAAHFGREGQEVLAALLRTETHKYVRYLPQGREQLYDLEADPCEHHNLAADRPEQCAELRTRLLDRMMQSCRSYREHHLVF